jgi:FeS assembly SUF system protein
VTDLPVVQASAGQTPLKNGSSQADDLIQDPERGATLTPEIVKAVSKVFDPEIPVNIYDLGLIYGIVVDRAGTVGIKMTLTAPACPAAQFLPEQVRAAAAAVPGVTGVVVDVVWDPPWDRGRMSDAAKLQLGMF